MASIRFLVDKQVRILEMSIKNGSLTLDERVAAVRTGQIYQIDSYDNGPENTINVVFGQNSPLRGIVLGISKADITLNPDVQPELAQNQGGCKSC